MRGVIVMFDKASGLGTIHGDDGNHYRFTVADANRPYPTHNKGDFKDDQGRRYTFTATEIVRAVEFRSGMRVEFMLQAGEAKQIVVVPEGASSPTQGDPQRSAQAVNDQGAVMQAGRRPSMWTYFLRSQMWWKYGALGRASRKEYWGTYIYGYVVGYGCGYFVGWAIGFATPSAMESDVMYGRAEGFLLAYLGSVLVALYIINGLLSGCLVNIRRLHDAGRSGWWLLVPFYSSWLLWFVPSEPWDNRWGAPPE